MINYIKILRKYLKTEKIQITYKRNNNETDGRLLKSNNRSQKTVE